MNWKNSKWIVMTALSVLLLGACNSDSTTTPDDNNSNIEEPSDANEINIEFTLEDAIEKTVLAYSSIMDILTDAGIKHNTDDMQIDENIYEEIKSSFSTHTTENYIENGLKKIALQYCYSCDNIFIPKNPTYAIQTELKALSNTKAVLTSTYNRNSIEGQAMEESIIFKREDQQWKIDQSTMQSVALNLDVEQALKIFEIEAYTNPTFIEGTMLSIEGGSEEFVFIFDTNEGRYAITQADGYIVSLD